MRELTGAAAAARRLATAARGAHELRRRWRAGAVAVTLGARRRAALPRRADPAGGARPGHAPSGDTCGAGDRFAATASLALARGALVSEAVQAAVAEASAYVAGGGVAAALPRRSTGAHRRGRPGRRADRHRGGRGGAGRRARRRRHGGRHRRLLRPAARRARGHPAGRPPARRLPGRLPQLRRQRGRAEGPGPAGGAAGRPGPAAGRAGLRGRGRRSSTSRPRTRRCPGCARTSGSRAGTTPPATGTARRCPRRSWCAAGAGRRWSCRTWTGGPPPT